jgi:hypothetical protein
MATSNVAIANGALQRLGTKRIESLTQDAPNARSMNAAFERVRKRLLRRYDWSFAIARASIAADSDGPTWGDWNRYSLPNDFIRLIRDDESGQEVDWKIEGQYILSGDASPLEIRYIADITDPNSFDTLFIEAFECKLALECCEEITGSTAKRSGVQADYDDAIAEAKRMGAIEKGAQEFPEDEWLRARR